MKLFLNRISFITLIAMSFLMAGCDKTELYDVAVPPPQAHFIGAVTRVYPVIVDPAPVFTLQVGSTDVVNSDRTVTYRISSPTGAVAGTHYTISTPGTVTIPAGKALSNNIDIQAIYSEYAGGRKDTLVFTLGTPSMEIASFLDTVTVVLAGPSGCSESIVDLSLMVGDYANTIETLATNPPYGPYTTRIASAVSTGATTATIVVENIWDNGWGPITFNLDWTDVANRTVEVVQQDAIPGSDAGDLNPTYAGQTVAVRPYATSGPGTYSFCDQTLTLNMQLGVTALGWFPILYQVNMAR